MAAIRLLRDHLRGGDKLEITSNSSVFGSTLNGKDSKGEKSKLSSSKVTGSWVRETGVENDKSSSYTGSTNHLSTTKFNQIAKDALDTSIYWKNQGGTSISVNLDDKTRKIVGSTGSANIFNVTSGFILNSGAKLILDGDPGDFFVFNHCCPVNLILFWCSWRNTGETE